jgi:hypothetical protein
VDFTDLTHQVEHTRTAAEQREADVRAGLRAGRTFRTERAASYWKVPAGRLPARAGNTAPGRHRGARSRRDGERAPSSEVELAGEQSDERCSDRLPPGRYRTTLEIHERSEPTAQIFVRYCTIPPRLRQLRDSPPVGFDQAKKGAGRVRKRLHALRCARCHDHNVQPVQQAVSVSVRTSSG